LTRKVTSGFLVPFVQKLRNPTLAWADITAVIEKDKADLLWALKVVEDKLGKQDYIAGNAWTLADYNVAAELSQWSGANAVLPSELKVQNFPNVQKYVERVAQREGWEAFVAPFKFMMNALQVPVQ
jgi:glutathione S-transferase